MNLHYYTKISQYAIIFKSDSHFKAFESSPKSVTLELLHQTAYRNKALGNALVTPHFNVHHLDNTALAEFADATITSDNVVVVASGGVEHEEFVKLVEQHFTLPKSTSK
jgi:processing peptidase subunit beta